MQRHELESAQLLLWLLRPLVSVMWCLTIGVDEVVSRRRFFVERTAAAVSRPRATSRPRSRRAAPAGRLLRRTVPSDMVAQLPTRQSPFAAARSEAFRLAKRPLRIPLHVSQSTGVSKPESAAICHRNVRRDGKNDP